MNLPFHSGIYKNNGFSVTVPLGGKKPKTGSEQLDFSIMNQLEADNPGFTFDF